ncbi:MAG: peptidylprolyl isomerase [Planctomyces sp.]|nr:peptidylprolyl isomerase [Planctomyces sp.]
MLRKISLAAWPALLMALFGCAGADNLVDAADPSTSAPGTNIRLAADETPKAAADVFYVKLETSKGDIILEVHPDWAPIGAAHFKELVEAKFYDDCRFFRVLDGFMAQIGMNGDPKVHAEWGEKTIKDEPTKRSNKRGFVTYAKSGLPNSRSTQFFINYGDNSFLDNQGFAPFAIVVEGMAVADGLYKEYGEGAPMGRGPSQESIRSRGNEYLNQNFPKLDYVKTARVVDKSEVKSLQEKGG